MLQCRSILLRIRKFVFKNLILNSFKNFMFLWGIKFKKCIFALVERELERNCSRSILFNAVFNRNILKDTFL